MTEKPIAGIDPTSKAAMKGNLDFASLLGVADRISYDVFHGAA